MQKRWLLGITILTGTGCGGPMPISPQEFCEGLQRAYCAKVYECATTPEAQAVLKLLYADQNDCVMQGIGKQKPVCSQWTESNVCGGFATWNGAAAATCVNSFGDQTCGQVVGGTLSSKCTPGAYCI